MQDVTIGENVIIDKGIIAENTKIGDGALLGTGDFAPSTYNPKVYASDLVTIGEDSVIPAHVRIGRNTAILGTTTASDYPDGMLAGGDAIIKAGEMV